jgi:HD superfamily phosphohydrolase
VYPGASGTRFEHSLGVYHLACRFAIKALSFQEFAAKVKKKEIVTFLLASLLHDIGHFPFAHQIEEFLIGDFPEHDAHHGELGSLLKGHHYWGTRLIRSELSDQLRREFGMTDKDMDNVVALISGTKRDCRGVTSLFKSLLDGVFDIDKLDYVQRDSHHCGVPYGAYIDVDRLIETMQVRSVGKGDFRLGFHRRGVGCLEQFATARHQLYANVYWHRAVRAATLMFRHWVYLLISSRNTCKQAIGAFWSERSDEALLAKLSQIAEGLHSGHNRNAAKLFYESISGGERTLFKLLLEAPYCEANMSIIGKTYPEQRRKARFIYGELKRDGMFTSAADELNDHNILIDCRTDRWPDFETIPIWSEQSDWSDLGRYAPMVGQLGKTFKQQACWIRVYVNAKVLSDRWSNKQNRQSVGQQIVKNLSMTQSIS